MVADVAKEKGVEEECQLEINKVAMAAKEVIQVDIIMGELVMEQTQLV
jgi:hypothetical protein